MLKRHFLGIESEFFVLDNNGFVSNKSDKIIKEAKDKTIKKEIAHNLIEINTNPYEIVAYEIVAHTIDDMLEKTKKLQEITEKNDSRLFYYGTYPGKINPRIRKGKTNMCMAIPYV